MDHRHSRCWVCSLNLSRGPDLSSRGRDAAGSPDPTWGPIISDVGLMSPTDEEILSAAEQAEAEPDEVRYRVRLAELHRRSGDLARAADAYRRAGRAYAVQGDWLRAFAVARALLHLDPADRETQRYVSALYAKRPQQSRSRDRSETSSISLVLDGPTPPPLTSFERYPLETTRIPQLKTLTALHDLEHGDLALLAPHLRTVSVPRGRVVFREGEVSEGMFIILRGSARVTVVDETGRAAPLSRLGEGDLFGEFSLIGAPLRTALVETTARTEFLEVDRELYELLTERSDVFRAAVGSSIRRRQKENVLARSSLLATLSPDRRAVIARELDTLTVLSGELVVGQGEPADRVFVLGSGRIEVYERDETGEKIFASDLLPGQFVPDPAVIDGGLTSVNARATEPSVVFWLARQVLLDHVGNTPARLRKLRQTFTDPPQRSGAFAAVHSQPLPDTGDDRR